MTRETVSKYEVKVTAEIETLSKRSAKLAAKIDEVTARKNDLHKRKSTPENK